MNIYRFELYKRLKSMIIMPLCIGLFTFAGMGKFEGLKSSGTTRELYATFPRPIRIVFGLNDIDITTLAGYTGTIFLYLVIILGVYCAYLGVDGAIGEKLNKQIDFVYALPVSRKQLFVRKVFAHMSVITVMTLITSFVLVLALLPFKGNESLDFLVKFQLALFLTELFFYAFGVLVGALLKNRIAVSLATGSVMLFFFLGVVFRFFEWQSLYLFSPFTSLSAVELLGSGSLIPAICVYTIAVIGFIFFGYVMIENSDM